MKFNFQPSTSLWPKTIQICLLITKTNK